MSRSDARPTLLVFTLGPGCERSRWRLLPGPLQKAAGLLHLQGLQGAIDAGKRAGFRIVVSSPGRLVLPPGVEHSRQQGSTFAERLQGAIHDLQADQPGVPLVIVGTDAPDLDARHLRQALVLLDGSPSDVVLGPSRDGGFYLLATRESLAAELEEVRWCRRDTRRCLERALHRRGRKTRHLEPLLDLDHFSDVETWLAASTTVAQPSWLRRVLSRLLAAWRRPAVHRSLGRPLDLLAAATSGRGPPV